MTAQQPLATHTDLTGRVLLGRYRIVRELAKGGMGVVYLARVEGAVGFVKPVVVKLLLPEHTEDARIVQMFVREAQILAQLRHPSLVDVLEFGEQDGGYVLVLEYVRGYHLGLWLRYLHEKKRTASADVLISIVIDVLDALHHAHTQVHPDGSPMQIVHRDVSPSNILLDESGRGRLLDFGVARMRGGGHEYKTQVQGGFMGKLPYTAPEIFSGGEASPRSDLYACAVVLHESLFGRNVFRGETQASTLQRVLNHVPEALESNPDVPRGLDKVLARALSKSPGERHADAHELAMDLRKLLHAPESEIRARLAQLLKHDFGLEMSKLFNLESLEERDVAWRRLSIIAPPPDSSGEARSLASANDQGAAVGKATAPVPAGATIVSRNRRSTTQGEAHEPAKITAPGRAMSRAAAAAPEVTPAELRRQYYDGLDDEDKTRLDPATISIEAPAIGSSLPPTPVAPPPAAAERRGYMPYTLAAIGVLAVAGLSIAVLTMRTQEAPSPPTPTGAAGTPTVFHPANPRPTPEEALPQPAQPTPQPAAAIETPDEPDKTKRTPKTAGPNASALTRALRKQQTKLEACFLNHSVSLEGHATTQLIFDLGQDGSLKRVELSPPLLGKTDLGQCLLKVARSTRFPPQPHDVSFTIPLTASTTRQ